MEPLLALEQEEGGARLVLSGQWHLAWIADIDAALNAAAVPASPITLDGARLEASTLQHVGRHKGQRPVSVEASRERAAICP